MNAFLNPFGFAPHDPRKRHGKPQLPFGAPDMQPQFPGGFNPMGFQGQQPFQSPQQMRPSRNALIRPY